MTQTLPVKAPTDRGPPLDVHGEILYRTAEEQGKRIRPARPKEEIVDRYFGWLTWVEAVSTIASDNAPSLLHS